MDEIGDQEIHEHISIIFFEDILFVVKHLVIAVVKYIQ